MLEKAVEFLLEYIDDIINKKGKMQVSYDLWEMHEGVSAYSLSCIFAAFNSMLKIYSELEGEFAENRLKQENVVKQREILEHGLEDIKEYIKQNLYNEERKSFVRSKTDNSIDMSVLGLVTPFEVFSPNEKKITNTVETINLNLRTYTRRILKI